MQLSKSGNTIHENMAQTLMYDNRIYNMLAIQSAYFILLYLLHLFANEKKSTQQNMMKKALNNVEFSIWEILR